MDYTSLREQVKNEVDKVKEQHLEMVHQFLKTILDSPEYPSKSTPQSQQKWKSFVNETYGSLSDAPIKRWKEGAHEIRESIE